MLPSSRKQRTYHQGFGKNMGQSGLSYREASEWEGPSCIIISQKVLVSQLHFPHPGGAQPTTDSSVTSHHAPLWSHLLLSHAPPTPSSPNTPENCGGSGNLSLKCLQAGPQLNAPRQESDYHWSLTEEETETHT